MAINSASPVARISSGASHIAMMGVAPWMTAITAFARGTSIDRLISRTMAASVRGRSVSVCFMLGRGGE